MSITCRRRLAVLAVVAAAFAVLVLWLIQPRPMTAADLPTDVPDLANGRRLFDIGGCASCHAMPKSTGDDRLKLGGWLVLATPFGKFHVPNISPDRETGIGNWTAAQFASAMLRGVGADGEHLYPSFPYTSYARMSKRDVLDLYAYLKTLPPVSHNAGAHELVFPFNLRFGLGAWKLLFFSPERMVELPAGAGDDVRHGQYLVEGPGHCGECHTPRGRAGNLLRERWLAGAANLENPKSHVPALRAVPKPGTKPGRGPGRGGSGIGSWSADDIATALSTGLTPDGDSLGGSMADVVANYSQASKEDLAAIAAYLKALPPLD